MDYYNVQLTLDKSQVDHYEALLEEAGSLSISMLDAEDQPIYEPKPNDLWDVVVMLGLFDNKDSATHMVQQLQKYHHADGLLAIAMKTLADQQWERVWLKDFKPLHCGGLLWVCPTTMAAIDDHAVNLRLDPGLAFGSGTHPTTWQCLHWLSQTDLKDKTVLDYGCGSGILAIAAVLLGAKSADCIDIEDQAMTATRQNAITNGLSEQQIVTLGMDMERLVARDVVLANILAEPLVQLKDTLISLVKPGGYLVLSGVLENQVDQIKKAYSGIDFEVKIKDEWAILFAHLTNVGKLNQTNSRDGT